MEYSDWRRPNSRRWRAGWTFGGTTCSIRQRAPSLGSPFSPHPALPLRLPRASTDTGLGDIRDLPSKRLYAFNPSAAPAHSRALIGGKINQAMIERNWPDILRIAATIAAGSVAPARFCASSPPTRHVFATLRCALLV